MTTFVAVSLTPSQADALSDGPRRDVLELARHLNGTVVYRSEAPRRRPLTIGRITGPHMKQAWHLAGTAAPGDLIFADGEHIGIPLVAFLWLRRKVTSTQVAMIGHLVSKSWKRRLLWLVSRTGGRGKVFVHSSEQFEAIKPMLGSRWSCKLVPYQVDTAYWSDEIHSPEQAPTERPLFVAAGAENRDYSTLIDAARGVDADFVVAAGSHWARKASEFATVPQNVTVVTQPLPFADLRNLYHRSSAVVVPLRDVPNQSGVTSILEAMSMGKPVIVTASRGQKECVTGPLVTAEGEIDAESTADRGPEQFDSVSSTPCVDTGLYVVPGCVSSLRAALNMLAPDRFAPDGSIEVAERVFSLDRFVERLTYELSSASLDGQRD